MSADGDPLARLDEVLELLFWFEGEGLGDSATLSGIARFLTHGEDETRQALDHLVSRGDVRVLGDGPQAEFRLTDVGRREGGRRFAEEFATLLSQGHGECNDPDCDCHDDPAGAAECHARIAKSHRH